MKYVTPSDSGNETPDGNESAQSNDSSSDDKDDDIVDADFEVVDDEGKEKKVIRNQLRVQIDFLSDY